MFIKLTHLYSKDEVLILANSIVVIRSSPNKCGSLIICTSKIGMYVDEDRDQILKLIEKSESMSSINNNSEGRL